MKYVVDNKLTRLNNANYAKIYIDDEIGNDPKLTISDLNEAIGSDIICSGRNEFFVQCDSDNDKFNICERLSKYISKITENNNVKYLPDDDDLNLVGYDISGPLIFTVDQFNSFMDEVINS